VHEFLDYYHHHSELEDEIVLASAKERDPELVRDAR
jgi:hypothetical protein